MKKIFLFAAALMASVSMMADVDFAYNKGEGDVLADGTTTMSATQASIPAGEVMAQGTHFTVKNKFAVDYKTVGVMADTAYSHIDINGTVVDFTNNRVQGQTNPVKVDGLTMPSGGACYELTVDQDGYFVVFVKATRNKQQFVFENVTEAAGVAVATPIEFHYNFMSNNTSETFFGKENGTNGLAEVYFKGDEGGELHQAPGTPAAMYANSGYGIDGCGFLMFKVLKDYAPYVFGTWGSKMMAAGFAFVPEADFANLSIVAKGSATAEKTYADATLWPAAEQVISDLSVTPKKFKINATMPEAWMNDTTRGYNAESTTKKKCSVYIWADGVDGKIYEMAAVKDAAGAQTNEFTYTFESSVAEKINCIFINGTKWDGDANQTVDITNLTEGEHCYVVTAGTGKATVEACSSAVENIELNEVSDKFIHEGHLYIQKNGVIYNAMGAIVK